jgi:hypothetical protein
MEIRIVNDQACPECGAYWGHPDPALDFPNRPKVDDDWKCYNPECRVGYYRNGAVVEWKPTPERAAEIEREAQEWVAKISFGRTWTEVQPNVWKLVPDA